MNEERVSGMFLDLLSKDISEGRLEVELPADVISFAGTRNPSTVDEHQIIQGEVDL
jgi:hypothetical protein